MSKWKNAPVVYVIVQVRFSPVLSINTYLPQIQEHFRLNEFPVFGTRFNFQAGRIFIVACRIRALGFFVYSC